MRRLMVMLTAAAIALVACGDDGGNGGGGGGGGGDLAPKDQILALAERTNEAGTAHFEFTFDVSGLKEGNVSFGGEGESDFAAGNARVVMELPDIGGMGLGGEMEIRTIDGTAYIRSAFINSFLGA